MSDPYTDKTAQFLRERRGITLARDAEAKADVLRKAGVHDISVYENASLEEQLASLDEMLAKAGMSVRLLETPD